MHAVYYLQYACRASENLTNDLLPRLSSPDLISSPFQAHVIKLISWNWEMASDFKIILLADEWAEISNLILQDFEQHPGSIEKPVLKRSFEYITIEKHRLHFFITCSYTFYVSRATIDYGNSLLNNFKEFSLSSTSPDPYHKHLYNLSHKGTENEKRL